MAGVIAASCAIVRCSICNFPVRPIPEMVMDEVRVFVICSVCHFPESSEPVVINTFTPVLNVPSRTDSAGRQMEESG